MTQQPANDRLPAELPADPMQLAFEWFSAAQTTSGLRNPNAMTLATVGENQQPSARVVLCKSFVPDPGYLVFHTNYESHKGRELAALSRVAVVMHWDSLGRQIRIEGEALRSPASESDAYFATRGWGSQLGAWGSDQSRPVGSREQLVAQLRQRATSLGIELGDDTTTLAAAAPPAIARPPHWGGFRIWAHALELWTEGSDRIHDRARWQRSLSGRGEHDFIVGAWSGRRLQP